MPTLAELRATTIRELGDGIHAFVKRDCAACTLVAPVLASLVSASVVQTVHSQDDVAFPEQVASVGTVTDDTSLSRSFALDIETVPTLVRIKNGEEVGRTFGWSIAEWSSFVNADLVAEFGSLPAWRPGCGSKNLDIGMPEKLAAVHRDPVNEKLPLLYTCPLVRLTEIFPNPAMATLP